MSKIECAHTHTRSFTLSLPTMVLQKKGSTHRRQATVVARIIVTQCQKKTRTQQKSQQNKEKRKRSRKWRVNNILMVKLENGFGAKITRGWWKWTWWVAFICIFLLAATFHMPVYILFDRKVLNRNGKTHAERKTTRD